jgi:hypothetical protein
MPQSKQRRLSGNGELIPPLSVSERILELLKIQQKTFPPKELDQGEIERWVATRLREAVRKGKLITK